MIVLRPALEASLAELRAACADPRAGLFGPSSSMWRLSRESILFLGGGRAALLQLAHPYVATAVAHHSKSEKDLAGRFQRTFMHVFAMIFGDLDSAIGSARRVHGLHKTVAGSIEEPLGPYPAGHRYEANDPQALLWVHATLVDTAVLVYDRVVAPLSPAAREAHYQETKRFARLFGLDDSVLPRDWPSFRAYFDGMLDSGVLTIGAASRKMGRFLLTPPNVAVSPMWRWYAVITAALLPPRLREGFGLRWGRRERALAAATIGTLAKTWRRMPRALRDLPAYRDAERRLRGAPDRDPLGLVAERIVLTALRQE